MMLEALLTLAERKGLLDDPSFGKRTVNYQLRITDDGQPVALIPLGEEGRGRILEVPAPPKRTVAVDPAFLVDSAQYILGLPKGKKGQPPDARARARAGECLAAFRCLLGLRAGFPVFATGPGVILAHSQTIAEQGEKKGGRCEFHSSRRTTSTAPSPWRH